MLCRKNLCVMGSKESLQKIFNSNLAFCAAAALIVLMAFSIEFFEPVWISILPTYIGFLFLRGFNTPYACGGIVLLKFSDRAEAVSKAIQLGIIGQ